MILNEFTKGVDTVPTILIDPDKGTVIHIVDVVRKEEKYTRNFDWYRYTWRQNTPWNSIESIFKLLGGFRREEGEKPWLGLKNEEWTAELIATEYLMYEHHEGGGLTGVDDDYYRHKANLTAMGKELLAQEAMKETIDKRRRGNEATQG